MIAAKGWTLLVGKNVHLGAMRGPGFSKNARIAGNSADWWDIQFKTG